MEIWTTGPRGHKQKKILLSPVQLSLISHKNCLQAYVYMWNENTHWES